MEKIIRRTLILAGLVAVAVLLLNKLNSGEPVPRYTPEQLKTLLDRTVRERWQAIVTNDWVKVYEFESPETRKRTNLTTYMQGKDAVSFTRFEVKSVSMDGYEGTCDLLYDWEIDLVKAGIKVKLDKGKPKQQDVPIRERYRFHPDAGRWYFVSQEILKR